jgi:signal transduction histidine kinase
MSSPPRFRSLRWQLPLSYAAIALFAVLALGIALLGTLQGLYQQQEMAYLAGNAAAIAEEIAPLMADEERPFLQSRIDVFSFLTQTRVQVLAEDGLAVLADSGELETFVPAISFGSEEGDSAVLPGLTQEDVVIVIEEQQEISDGTISSQKLITRTTQLSAQGSLFGFNLVETPTAVTDRSDLVEETTIIDESGAIVGFLRLSQGPAYGSIILRSVAWGWVIAGFIAILLAALIGWLVSRRLTKPLGSLTAVTERMAAGDLSVRTNLDRADELGILGDSFNQMAAQVENTVTTLRQFAADAAHELHTPLTALQTDLQLLTKGGTQAEQAQRMQRAQSQAVRLQLLADSLLDLSRLEAEPMRGEQPLIDLTQLLQVVGELAASQAEQMGVDFQMDVPETAVLIHGDALRLQQALGNLLDNSLKFTPVPGEIGVLLKVEGETAVITIRDSGIGIPPEDLPKLFTRFHRGANSAHYAGSGLGLAIVNAIITGHGGEVSIENQSKGTKVQIRLPA